MTKSTLFNEIHILPALVNEFEVSPQTIEVSRFGHCKLNQVFSLLNLSISVSKCTSSGLTRVINLGSFTVFLHSWRH